MMAPAAGRQQKSRLLLLSVETPRYAGGKSMSNRLSLSLSTATDQTLSQAERMSSVSQKILVPPHGIKPRIASNAREKVVGGLCPSQACPSTNALSPPKKFKQDWTFAIWLRL
jgi:hypothetical protein